jgi:Uma2 family endonuclease
MGAEQAIRAADASVEEGDPVRHLITVDEFLILDEAGAFENVGRVQLIDGEIFVMNAVHRPHAKAQAEILIAISLGVRKLKANLTAYAPVSTHLDDHSLPEPDVVVATVEDDRFVSRDSVRLAVEVSSSSLQFDLGRKARLYARTGVPEYWVVDVVARKIIRMAGPENETYAQRDEFAWGSPVPSATIPDLLVDTTALA